MFDTTTRLLKTVIANQEKMMATLATLQAAIGQEGTDITALQSALSALATFITGQLTTDINNIITALQNSGGNPALIAQLQATVQAADAQVQAATATITSTQAAATTDDTNIQGATGSGSPSTPATKSPAKS